MARAIVLGAVVGLAEFLPISPAAHVLLVPWLLGWGIEPVDGVPLPTVYALGELGVLVALLAAARSWWARPRPGVEGSASRRVLLLGAIPAFAAGALSSRALSLLADRPDVVAGLLLVTAALHVVATEGDRQRAGAAADAPVRGTEEHPDLPWARAGLVGAAQLAASFPGISRMALALTGGRAAGLSSRRSVGAGVALAAAFALGVVIGGAGNLAPALRRSAGVAIVVAGAVGGYVGVRFLVRSTVRGRVSLRPFALSAVAAAALAFGYWLQVK